MKKLFKNFWLSISWSIIVLITSITPVNLPSSHILYIQLIQFDKIVHFLIYAILTVLLQLNFSRILENKYFILILSFSLSLLYGLFIELIQGITLYRTSEFFDFTANLAGITTLTLYYYLFKCLQ